jgi:hypothetical protein
MTVHKSRTLPASKSLAEAAHVHFDAIRADVFGELKRAKFLAFQDHPVAHADLVALTGV